MKKVIILLFVIALSLAILEIGVNYVSMDSKDIPIVKFDEIRFTEKVSEYHTVSSTKAIDENDPTNKLFNSIYQKSYSQNRGISWSYNKYLRKAIFMTLNSIIITNDIQELGYMGYLNPSYYNNITLGKEIDELDQKSRNENISLEERNNAHIEYEKKANLAYNDVYTKSSKAISSNVLSMPMTANNIFPEYFMFSKFNFLSTNTNANVFDTYTIGYLFLSDMMGSPGIELFDEEPFPLLFRNNTMITQKERKESSWSKGQKHKKIQT